MKVILIGVPYPWHHTMIAKHFFEGLGANVTQLNPEDLTERNEPYKIQIEDDTDYVMVFQGVNSFEIIRSENCKARVIQFCGEVYWKPSCMNPDYLICAFPEMLDRYKFQYPTYFPQLKGFMEHKMFVDPKVFDSMKPKKPGVFFRGAEYAGRGPLDFRSYRRGYDDRLDFVEKCGSLIQVLETDYEGGYNDELCTHEAELVIHGLNAYMSKRPLENACAGAVNLLYIKDAYQILYYERLGWKHMENCYYIVNKYDICDYLRLPHDVKQDIRVKSYQHTVQNFTLHSIWNEWVKWFQECENKK